MTVKNQNDENLDVNLSDINDLMNYFGNSFEEFTEISLF